MKKLLTVLCLALLLTLVCASALALDTKYMHNGQTINLIMSLGTVNGKTIDTSRVPVVVVEPKCATGRVDIPVVPTAANKYEAISLDPIHDWKLVTYDGQAASCEKGGLGHYVCEMCGVAKPGDVEIPRREHDKTKEVIDKAATCSKDGLKHLECKYCGEPEKNADGTTKYTTISYTTHTYREGPIKVDKVQTCKEGGIRYYTCAECGEPKWKTPGTEIDIDTGYNVPGPHDWGEYIITTPATCVDGSQTRYCKVCNTSETKVIEGTGLHTWKYTIIPNGKCYNGKPIADVSCFSTAKRTCSVCGLEEALTDAYFIDNNYTSHHAYTVSKDYPSQPAGCVDGSDGYRYLVCSKCGDVYLETLPHAVHHTFGEWQMIKKPTATTDGIWERYCTNYMCTGKESYVGKTAPSGAAPVATSTSGSSTTPPSGSENYKITSWNASTSGASGQVKGNVTYRTPGLHVHVTVYSEGGFYVSVDAPVDESGHFSASTSGAVKAIRVNLTDNSGKDYFTQLKHVN